MRLRIPATSTGSALATLLAAVFLFAAATLTHAGNHLSKTSATSNIASTPQQTSAPLISDTATPTTRATNTPAVAGASTVAPVKSSSQDTSRPAMPVQAQPAVQAPAPMLLVTVVINGQQFTVNAANVTNACDVLTEAKLERKISSVVFDNKYLDTYKSLMVTEINGYKGAGWTYSAADAAGNNLQVFGCSLTLLKAGYSVTWKPA